HRLSTAYHPQTSGQVEVSNRGLKRILEGTIGENRASWSDKLNDALWAFRTAYKTPIGCTPYKLVYGKACHLLIELEHKAYWALKQENFNLTVAGDNRKIQLNELNEIRDHAYENSLIYKEKTKKIHDSKIKNRVFNVGDRVLLFNSRLKIFSVKLKTCWSGPFTITKVFAYGTIELSQANGPNFKVNGHRVKHYFGGDVPQLPVELGKLDSAIWKNIRNALENDPTSPKVDQSYLDSERDILLLEAFLNYDPSLPTPNQGNYLPQVQKELKICEAKSDKSSIDEPPEVELKDLPPHLEYAFLEGDNKLPVIIAKDLRVKEKTALITVLKSHKRAIAWKLFDIK
nr:reverse transcriptase domain-containing protein [Tanacetum cinerariifolium]